MTSVLPCPMCHRLAVLGPLKLPSAHIGHCGGGNGFVLIYQNQAIQTLGNMQSCKTSADAAGYCRRIGSRLQLPADSLNQGPKRLLSSLWAGALKAKATSSRSAALHEGCANILCKWPPSSLHGLA